MERTIYTDGVEVRSDHLAFTESSKARQAILRTLALGQAGVVSGLQVTIDGSDPTRVNIATGSALTPSGELVEVDAAQLQVAMASYVSGVDNYVGLVYAETQTRPEAPLLGGDPSKTRAEARFRVRVLTAADLAVMLPTSSDFAQDALDRFALAAIVPAQGEGAPLTTVLSVQDFTRVLGTSALGALAGVEVVSLSEGTPTTDDLVKQAYTAPTTNAQLQMVVTYTYPAPPSSVTLAYKAPGDTVFGAAVNVTAGGTFTLTSDTTSRTAVVDVHARALPAGGLAASPATLTETLDVVAVYEERVQRAGARDEALRHAIGSSAPTAENPLGLKLEDLGASVQRLLGTLDLGEGLASVLWKALLPRLVGRAPLVWNTGATVFAERVPLLDFALEHSALSPAPHVRVYLTSSPTLGFAGLEVAFNARWNQTDSGSRSWACDNTARPAVVLAIGTDGVSVAELRYHAASAGSWSDTGWSSHATGDLDGAVRVAQQAEIGADLLGTATDWEKPRLTVKYSNDGGADYTCVFASPAKTGAGNVQLRVFCGPNIFGGTSTGLVITANANWQTGVGWVADDVGVDATALSVDEGGVAVRSHPSGAATWLDTAWSRIVDLRNLFAQFFTTCSATAFVYAGVVTRLKSLSPASAALVGTWAWVTSGSIPNITHGVSSGTSGSYLLWDLDLPDGAEIIDVELTLTSASTGPRVYVQRYDPTTGAVTSLRTTAPGYVSLPSAALGVPVSLLLDASSGIRTVDNDTYNYKLVVELPSGASCSVYRAEVRYYVTEPS